MLTMNKRVVSVDVGIKYIGLAMTDKTWTFPRIVGTINRKQSINDDLERLSQLLGNITVSAFVVGFPYNLDRTEGRMTPIVKGVERRLKEIFPEALFFRQDESFSSIEAVDAIGATVGNYKKHKKSGKIDSAAAAIILQRFMETEKFKMLKAKGFNS